jgi:hypothetical protein
VTRQKKTPRQRAEEALGVANRRVIALDKKVDALRIELAQTEREHRDAITRRDYLAQHPDLQQHPTTTLEEPTP